MLVELTGPDMVRATNACLIASANAIDRGYHDRREGISAYQGFRFHLQGAMAELAVSIALKLPWSDENREFKTDVGDIEVRSRGGTSLLFSLREYELRKHQPGQKFVFATVDMDSALVTLNGWATIGHLRHHWRTTKYDTYERYLIDPRDLHDIGTVLL